MVGPPANGPGTTFRAAARTAIASGNQAGAPALLRELLHGPPEAATALTPNVSVLFGTGIGAAMCFVVGLVLSSLAHGWLTQSCGLTTVRA